MAKNPGKLRPGANARPAAAPRINRWEPFIELATECKPGTEPMYMYARRSNRHNDSGDAIARQMLNMQDRFKPETGYTVMGAFVDNDSASKSAVENDDTRSGWALLNEQIEDGTVRNIVVDKLDRIYRYTRKQLEWVENNQKRGVKMFSLKDPAVIFEDSPMGHVALSVLASMAQGETMTMSTRQLDSKKHAAEAGFNHGGTRPFGWMPDPVGRVVDPETGRSGQRMVKHPVEFDALRDAVQLILDGASLADIARHWTKEYGITTASGRDVYGATVRRCLRSPRLMGYRMRMVPEHQRGVTINLLDYIARDENAKPVKAYPPVCDRRTWDRVQKAMDAGKNTGTRKPWGSNEWLLTGLLICSSCGGQMSGLDKQWRGAKGDVRKARAYRCIMNQRHGTGSCAEPVSIIADPLEEFVLYWVEGYLGREDRLAQARQAERERIDDPAAREELADALLELEALRAEQGSEKYKGAAVVALVQMIGDVSERVSTLEAQVVDAPVANIDADNGATFMTRWKTWDLGKKRSQLGVIIDHVTIAPGKGLPENRATITPRVVLDEPE